MLAKLAAAAALACLTAAAAGAAGAAYYENARFGYAVEIPPGFSAIAEADNSDGGTARGAEGELAVWGANLLDETFAADVRSRIASDAADGGSISDQAVKPAGASWSGSRGDRIAYSRAIPACAGQAAYLRVEYARAARKAFDPVVKRLVRSFRATGRCG